MTRHPVLTVIMAAVGIILLLPGACAAVVMIAGGLPPGPDASFLYMLWAVCFLVSVGGGFLLYKTFQKPTPRP